MWTVLFIVKYKLFYIAVLPSGVVGDPSLTWLLHPNWINEVVNFD